MELSEELRDLVNNMASDIAKCAFTKYYKNNPRYFGLTDQEYEYYFDEIHLNPMLSVFTEETIAELEYLEEKGILAEGSCESNDIYMAVIQKTHQILLALAKKYLQNEGKTGKFLSDKHRKRFTKTFRSFRKAS